MIPWRVRRLRGAWDVAARLAPSADEARTIPRLALVVLTIIQGYNFFFASRWVGAFGMRVANDFAGLYVGGTIARHNLMAIYDLRKHIEAMTALMPEAARLGVTGFIYPPHVGWLMSFASQLPILGLFITWEVVSVLAIIWACMILSRFDLQNSKLTKRFAARNISIAILSSFPFLIGFNSGNVHAFTFLLVAGITGACLSGMWLLAGILAAVLLYKPQFVIGFAVLFLLWRKYRALVGMMATAIGLYAFIPLQASLYLLNEFATSSSAITRYIPFAREFPQYAVGSLYVQLACLFPRSAESLVWWFCVGVSVFIMSWFMRMAWLCRSGSASDVPAVIAVCSILPFLVSPYWIIYDVISIVPGIVLFFYRYDVDLPDQLTAGGIMYLSPVFVLLFGMMTGKSVSGLLWLLIVALALWIRFKCRSQSTNAIDA